jgi:hypothetical protein
VDKNNHTIMVKKNGLFEIVVSKFFQFIEQQGHSNFKVIVVSLVTLVALVLVALPGKVLTKLAEKLFD